MNHPEHSPHAVNTYPAIEINGQSVEAMTLDELNDATITLSCLTQAIHDRRRQLETEQPIAEAAPSKVHITEEAKPLSAEEVQREKAKQKLRLYQESSKGRAIISALVNAYETPGEAYNITKPLRPLKKDSLAPLVHEIIPETVRTITLEGNRWDVEQEVDTPTKRIKGYKVTTAERVANKLIRGFNGTISDLSVSLRSLTEDEASDSSETYLLDIIITKHPTGKPTFREFVTIKLAYPEGDAGQECILHTIIKDEEASLQDIYRENSQRLGWTVASQNIASPLRGGLASPR